MPGAGCPIHDGLIVMGGIHGCWMPPPRHSTPYDERRPPIEPKSGPKKTRKRYPSDMDCLLAAARGLNLQPRSAGDDAPSITIPAMMLRVRDRQGADRFLQANPAQAAFEMDRGQRNIILKARQMGVTTWIAGRFFLKTVMNPGTLTVMVAQTQESAEGIFRVVQRFWECLDEYEQQTIFKRSIANVSAMRFPELDSEFRVLSASDPNAGRGLTIQNLHCSEVARWPGNAHETLAGLRAALVPSGELVLESTPNGAYGCFYEEWTKAVEPGQKDTDPGALVRHFFPWWMEPSYTAVAARDLTAEEEQLVARHGLSRWQIGFRRSLEANYRGLRSQEFAEDAETCFRATGDCCFDTEPIEARLVELGPQPGAVIETRRGGALEIYLPQREGKEYIVAVDSAGGGDAGDFAAIQVIHLDTGIQCAELQQRIRPGELAAVAASLANMYNGAIIAVERNNHGGAVLAYLNGSQKEARIYGQNEGHKGLQQGFLTTTASKPQMIARLGALLADSPGLFRSRRLLAECRTFVTYSGGRTGAAGGCHDDCLMAMAIAQAVRAEILVARQRPVATFGEDWYVEL